MSDRIEGGTRNGKPVEESGLTGVVAGSVFAGQQGRFPMEKGLLDE